MDLTPALKVYASLRKHKLNSQHPSKIQEKQLLALVAKARVTKFGRAHGFEKIRSVKDYQHQVPLRSYEKFWEEYWKPSFPNLIDCSWPGKIPFFAVSSGTSSGTTKYIPLTNEMNRSNSKAALDLLVHHVHNCPRSRLLSGKNFFLGGSTDLIQEAPGVFSGDLSGIVTKTLPWWAKSFYFPPLNLSLLKNWEEKIDTLAKASLKERIALLGGVPAWLLIFIDKLFSLVPEAENKLERIYPELEMVVHGGVNFGPYLERFKEILGESRAELREVYPASEGFVAVADRGYGEGLRMVLDHGIFFEFVPYAELGSPSPTRHWVKDIQTDLNYAVVLTTCAGLWSYILGDTVRFVEVDPPILLVTGRTSYYLSAFGEHLIAEEIEDAVAKAASKVGSEVTDYSVGPIYPKIQNELGGHLYIVEFSAGEINTLALSTFEKELDQHLCRRNEDYQAHRSDGFGLRAPKVVPVAPGTFAAWMKSRGKLGGQNKVPRIITNQELFSNLIQFVGQ